MERVAWRRLLGPGPGVWGFDEVEVRLAGVVRLGIDRVKAVV